MTCKSCQREIQDEASYCQYCGRRQGGPSFVFPKPLRRSLVDRKLAGICGGIARYLDTDPVFVRVAWVILSIVPGTILLGVLAYVVAWIIVPEAERGSEPLVVGARRMQRSRQDVTVAGVCGGIAEYFSVDVTAVRVLWVVLSIFPGFVICGLFAYAGAWFIMPEGASAPAAAPPPAPATDPAPAAGTD